MSSIRVDTTLNCWMVFVAMMIRAMYYPVILRLLLVLFSSPLHQSVTAKKDDRVSTSFGNSLVIMRRFGFKEIAKRANKILNSTVNVPSILLVILKEMIIG